MKAIKAKPVGFPRNLFRFRGIRGRTAALIAGVAITASAAVRLDAVVFDDFENPGESARLWTGWVWNGTGSQTVANGHVKLELMPAPYEGAFCNWMSRRTWTLREGRTLEFRADLLNSGCDGALAYFGFLLLTVARTSNSSAET